MTTLVTTLINAVKKTLQEEGVEGVRWTNAELIEYLNDSCRFLVEYEPDAFADNSSFACVAGTRQEVPENVTRLISIVRNLEGRKIPVIITDRSALDSMRPYWHSENPTNQQELYFVDDRDSKRFYVYPPAVDGSLLEIISAMEPVRHLAVEAQNNSSSLQVNDRYVPALMNYMLHRAFDKDSDTAGNFSRSQTYLQNAYNALQVKVQNTNRVSPNRQGNE
jgi:hypothetical protein